MRNTRREKKRLQEKICGQQNNFHFKTTMGCRGSPFVLYARSVPARARHECVDADNLPLDNRRAESSEQEEKEEGVGRVRGREIGHCAGLGMRLRTKGNRLNARADFCDNATEAPITQYLGISKGNIKYYLMVDGTKEFVSHMENCQGPFLLIRRQSYKTIWTCSEK